MTLNDFLNRWTHGSGTVIIASSDYTDDVFDLLDEGKNICRYFETEGISIANFDANINTYQVKAFLKEKIVEATVESYAIVYEENLLVVFIDTEGWNKNGKDSD